MNPTSRGPFCNSLATDLCPGERTVCDTKVRQLALLMTVILRFLSIFQDMGFKTTLVYVYVTLPVFTPVAGSSYAHSMEQNDGAHYVNSEFGRYFHFFWC